MRSDDAQKGLELLQKAFPKKAKPRRRQKLVASRPCPIPARSRPKPPRYVAMIKSDSATASMTAADALQRLERAVRLGNITGYDAVLFKNLVRNSGSVPDDLATYLRGIS